MFHSRIIPSTVWFQADNHAINLDIFDSFVFVLDPQSFVSNGLIPAMAVAVKIVLMHVNHGLTIPQQRIRLLVFRRSQELLEITWNRYRLVLQAKFALKIMPASNKRGNPEQHRRQEAIFHWRVWITPALTEACEKYEFVKMESDTM